MVPQFKAISVSGRRVEAGIGRMWLQRVQRGGNVEGGWGGRWGWGVLVLKNWQYKVKHIFLMIDWIHYGTTRAFFSKKQQFAEAKLFLLLGKNEAHLFLSVLNYGRGSFSKYKFIWKERYSLFHCCQRLNCYTEFVLNLDKSWGSGSYKNVLIKRKKECSEEGWESINFNWFNHPLLWVTL